ncbi:MAG: T9SS type A sorting domain-containing protein [Bacteroidia bacterium]|nr:T9SS type A sorting domain-containing protein [Bacteroidia bacterium]
MKAVILCMCLALYFNGAAGQTLPASTAKISTIDIPRLFVMNEGQWDERITASSMGLGPTVSFGREGYSVGIERGASLHSGDVAASSWPGMRLIAPSPRCAVVPKDESGPKAKYHKEVEERFVPYELTQYRSIAFEHAWSGIDVHVSRDASGMRHDFDVKAGADLSAVRLRFDNAEAAHLSLSGADGVLGLKPKLEEVDDGVEVTLGDVKVLRDFRVTLVYNYYWGGSHEDLLHDYLVDRAGNLIAYGSTYSWDFPLLPKLDPKEPVKLRSFLQKFDPTDGSLIYSLVYDQLTNSSSWSDLAVIGKNDNLILGISRSTISAFLTPDAEFQPSGRHTLVNGTLVFDSSGVLRYGTATPDSGRISLIDMTCDATGTLYALTHTTRTPDFITPDAVMRTHQGGLDALIMKFDADTYHLSYASCLGGSSNDWISAITVDGCGAVAVAGYSYSDDYPAVSAVQPQKVWGSDLVFTVISPDGRTLIYSTYLGGSGYDGWLSSVDDDAISIRFDPDGNLYFQAATTSPDFPLVNALMSRAWVSAIGKFNQAGQLVFSSYLSIFNHHNGGNFYGSDRELEVDACGNMILTGIDSVEPIPLLHPVHDKGRSTLVVIDPQIPEVLFCTKLGNSDWGGIHGDDDDQHVRLHGTTLYYGSSSVLTDESLPATAGFPAGDVSRWSEIQFTKIELPDLCSRPVYYDLIPRYGSVTAEMFPLDTVRVDPRRRICTPDSLIARCRIKNTSSVYPTDSVAVELRLPPGMRLSAFSPPLRQVHAPLAPLDSIDILWFLLPLSDTLVNLSSIEAVLHYSSNGDCPEPRSMQSVANVLVQDISDVEVSCGITLNPRPTLTPDRTRLQDDTLTIRVTISNNSTKPLQLKKVVLHIPSDAGVSLLEPHDPVAYPPVIPPGASFELQWKIYVQSWPFSRSLPIRAVLFDVFDIVVAQCAIGETIPGTAGSICGMSATEPVWYDANEATHTPSPILIDLSIRNVSDSSRWYRDLRLDLSRAHYLKPEVGETLTRPDFILGPDSIGTFRWRLLVSPAPVRDEILTVRALYRANGAELETACEVKVRIFVARPELDCVLAMQDSLHLNHSGDGFAEDSVEITALFSNTGSLSQQLDRAQIFIEPGGEIEYLNGVSQPLGNIPGGGSAIVRWYIRIPAHRLSRNFRCTAVAYNAAGTPITDCTSLLFAPALELRCSLLIPDSVHYDAEKDVFTPEQFKLQAVFHNATDTTLTNLTAVLDSTQLYRVRLSDPASAIKHLPSLSPGFTWRPDWEFEALWGPRAERQLFRVRFEYTPSNASTFCEASSIIGGAPRVAAMACATAGHDTVWTDSFYESLIPDPVQVQYTLRNTGNIPTPACELAILPPPALLLEAREDSIRSVPVLQPGDAFSAEWLLRIAMDKITPGSWPIRWVTQCADGVQPPQCEHSVFLRERAPEGVVLTPWLLRFEAERDGPLPALRHVQVWTGGGLTPSWTATSVPLWLDVSPLFGAGHTVMTAVPNTTALPLGEHADRIVLSETPISTGDVQVIYSIRTPLGVDAGALPTSLLIGAVYPNPATVGAMLAVEYRNTSAVEVTLSLHDLLGRERYAANHRATDGGLLHVSTRDLPPGAYVLRVRSGFMSAERLVVVR